MNGIPLAVDFSPALTLLILSVMVLSALWFQAASFPRESTRMGWTWSKPRQLLARNAAETPRTLGVWTGHAMTVFAVMLFLELIGWTASSSEKLGAAVGWVMTTHLLKRVGSKMALSDQDLASTLNELHRHGLCIVAIVLACWGVVCGLHPSLHGSAISGQVAWMLAAVGLGFAAWRASQVYRSASKPGLLGILYLCALEWGWSATWLVWIALVKGP